jgi:hypothetical protein
MDIIGRAPGIEVDTLKEPETEELEFVTDPIELGGAYCSLGRDLTQLPFRAGTPGYKAI